MATLGPLEDGVRLGDRPLVVADELGQDEPLRRVVRREEHPDQRHEDEEHGEAQHAERVEDRDRREQRRPHEVGDDHHAPRAPARDDRARGDAEDGDGSELDREHDAHARRGARRLEDEPGQREERHLRAERGHDDARDERADAPRAEDAHAATREACTRRSLAPSDGEARDGDEAHREGLRRGERHQHGLRPEGVEDRPDAEDAERLREPEEHHVHGHHARPERRRHAQRHERVDRRVDEAVREAGEAERRSGEPRIGVKRQDPQRERLPEDARADEGQPADALEQDAVRDRVARDRADAEGREEQARDARVGVEAGDDQHGHADEERRPGRVAEEEQRRPEPQQRLAREEPDAAARADVLVRPRARLGSRDEREDQRGRDEVGAAVHDERPRRRDERDEDAAGDRAEEHGDARCALEQRVGAGDDRLVLAEQLRDDHLLRGEVRGTERPEQEREHDDRSEGVVAEPVQHRDGEHQRCADQVGEEHRPPRAEPPQHGAARDPEQRQPDQLRADDHAHPRRRARRDEHEPRQREPRHLRPGRGDDLGRQQADDRPATEE